ncbi:hypothetical protein F2Q70_00000603 [Brassica cretica]|uniref:Uncharacterized protein n=1 Tax=Brassica cretica TaxID=69181 RepID=A0A8S9IPV4_BRACR|nr:hypothetical protein F2Q70_00000603 [Brassica cretica]
MDGFGGVACPAPAPVLHLSIDGRPALTPDTTPSSSVMVCRHLVFLSGFNLGSGGLEAVDEISNRSMMLSA